MTQYADDPCFVPRDRGAQGHRVPKRDHAHNPVVVSSVSLRPWTKNLDVLVQTSVSMQWNRGLEAPPTLTEMTPCPPEQEVMSGDKLFVLDPNLTSNNCEPAREPPLLCAF